MKLLCLDNDGKVELVIGHTDKFVRAYRWQEDEVDLESESSFSGGVSGLASGERHHSNASITGLPGSSIPPYNMASSWTSNIKRTNGHFVPVFGWRLKHMASAVFECWGVS